MSEIQVTDVIQTLEAAAYLPKIGKIDPEQRIRIGGNKLT